MPDLTASPLPAPPTEDLLQTLLDVSHSGIVLLAPVWAAKPGVAPVDWVVERLNPAAQWHLGLPARPGTSLLEHFPDARAAGLLDFCGLAYATEPPRPFTTRYLPSGFSTELMLSAQRSGERLVISISLAPSSESSIVVVPSSIAQPVQNGGAQEAAEGVAPDLAQERLQWQAQSQELLLLNEQLNTSNQTLRLAVAEAEQARASAESDRALIQAVLAQAPVAIGLFQGPEQIIVAANEQLCAMWGYPASKVLGRPLLLGVPELRGQGFAELISQVGRTRQPFVGTEMPAQLRQHGNITTRYFNFVYQPLIGAAGELLGVLDIAVDVTDQVQARQQVQNLNEELAATNEELRVTNEELFANNTELLHTQQQLQQLAQLLEDRVQERTQQLRESLAETREQRERLREQQGLLRQILWQVPAAIATLSGPEHRYSFFNASYQALTAGRTQLGAPVAAVFPEVVDQGFVSILDEVYRTGQPYTGTEMPVELHDPASGQAVQRYVDLVYEPLHDGQGQISGVLAFIVDSTEKVRARAAIEASTRQIRLMSDALPVLIGYLDREERYRFANRAYEVWFNLQVDELLGRPARDVIGEKAYAGVQPYIQRALAGERLSFEARMPYREGFLKHIRTDYIPDTRDGEVVGFYSLVSDVTEQVKSRQQLAAANEQLRATNANLDALNRQLQRTNIDLDNFIYTASHDLKSPITNIEGLLHALTEHLPAEVIGENQVQHILELMQQSVERFKRTIDYLTDVSKLQQEYAQPIEPVVLAEVVEDVRQDLLPLLQATDARLHVDVAECPTISFSPKNLRSVVYNLLSNALKYHHPDRAPEVSISCQRTDEYHLLRVQDNGLGLDESQRGRIFGMFQRLHSHVEGSGIGLYMVKKIVENAGGSINVDSRAGEGSTFTVAFPVAAAKP